MIPSPLDAPRQTAFGPVVQVAYHAPDISAAARFCAVTYGAGPFYMMEHIPLRRSLHRGRARPFDHTSAYGQCGDVMVELIHQHGDEPSAVRDMFSRDAVGLHHLAVFVPQLDAALSAAEEEEMAIALDAETVDGVRFVMADARQSEGCMIELYEQSDALARFYAFIRRKSVDWKGDEPLRRLEV
ncbi:MAG: hypothetical protein GC152_06410 [Alphaproteobacteria bacterium]|nr:hypothetical protein [Alphaproteobacteria bacterium]